MDKAQISRQISGSRQYEQILIQTVGSCLEPNKRKQFYVNKTHKMHIRAII